MGANKSKMDGDSTEVGNVETEIGEDSANVTLKGIKRLDSVRNHAQHYCLF